MRSMSSPLAVSITMGSGFAAARRSRQMSNPLFPGKHEIENHEVDRMLLQILFHLLSVCGHG